MLVALDRLDEADELLRRSLRTARRWAIATRAAARSRGWA